MNDERWQRIGDLFSAALAQPADRRAGFLVETCGDDVELRSEVESLLAHHRDRGPLDAPAVEWLGQVADEDDTEPLIGRRLGRFEVVSRLGSGGMGEVYLARDPALERRVALKLLPPHFAGDATRIERFRLEALAVSALNHPNILTVHEVTEVEGRQLLISELVEGETLRQLLRRGALPIASALEVTVQVARALAAAHGLGIVHRDVKPENVMVRRDGLVKLLDFGIAKSLAPRPEQSRSPADRPTEVGVILGTATYMSPEQTRGEPATRQSDIWALGCVLYEALTGRQAFAGESEGDVVAAILTREPDWSCIPESTPPLARSVLRRCLERNAGQRLHDVADARIELEEALRDPLPAPPLSRRDRRSWWIGWAAATLAVATVLLLAAMKLRAPDQAQTSPITLELPHPQGGSFFHAVESSSLALSPDGSMLGFVSLGRPGQPVTIWLRPLDRLEARQIAGTEGATSLFWSPDGEHIGFVAGGKLKRVPADGGSPVVLCNVETGSGVSGTWGNGSILIASIGGEGIFRVPADGGIPTLALRPETTRKERQLFWPWFLPDGERFLYLVARYDGTTQLRLSGFRGETRAVAPLASRVELVDPYYAVFAHEGALIAQRFDPDQAALVGQPLSLAPSVRMLGTTGSAAFSAAREGTVVVATRHDIHRLIVADSEGRTLQTLGASMNANAVTASRDGRRAIVSRLRPDLATHDLWIYDLERGVEMQLTDAPGTEVYAVWAPDERSVLYTATRGGVPNLLRRDLASGTEEDAVAPGPLQIPVGVTPDGRQVLYRQRTANGFELLVAPLDRRAPPTPVLRPGVTVWQADLSPDGRILAYISPEAGRPELFVRRFEGGESVRVSANGATVVRFAPDGETLYFTTPGHWMESVEVTPDPMLTIGDSSTRFELPALGWIDFDLLPDGRFVSLVRETDSAMAPLTVMRGWDRPRQTLRDGVR